MRWNRPKQELPAQTKAPPSVMATQSDLEAAYRLVLGRDVDPEGLRHYGELVTRGMPLRALIETLLGSDEFRARGRSDSEARPLSHEPLLNPDSGQVPGAGREIDPAEIIHRYTVEELIETAEEYYRRVTDPTPLMSKPFSFLHEAPEMLENLGHLLGGLELGKSMTVLDFGAGTCWLSRLIAQLNCRPICCDASRTALEIGRRVSGRA